MTAFAGPRVTTRRAVSVARPRASARESLQGFRGALRAATATRGSDYADALFLGRN